REATSVPRRAAATSGAASLRTERELEPAAAAELRRRGDLAAVALDDPAHVGEADAGALELAGAVQALEHLEQAIGAGHVEADAVVGDVVGDLVAARLAPDLDLDPLAVLRVLERVVD